jgi:hypothetical protein
VSTSFLKVVKILIKENISVCGTAITLPEGEGSTAYLLWKLGATDIYYDTLIDQTRLVPQRAINLVP